MQSFHLQILEKGRQQFDSVVGQDNRQNSKPLVSWNEKKVSLTECSSCWNFMTSFNTKPYWQKWFDFHVRHTLCQDQVLAILRHPWCVQQYPGHEGQQEDLSLSLYLPALWGSGSESGTGCSKDTRLRATGSSDNAEKKKDYKNEPQIIVLFFSENHQFLMKVQCKQPSSLFTIQHLLLLQLCVSYWWLVQSFHRSPAATTEISF